LERRARNEIGEKFITNEKSIPLFRVHRAYLGLAGYVDLINV
jgi:hypothetical protein